MGRFVFSISSIEESGVALPSNCLMVPIRFLDILTRANVENTWYVVSSLDTNYGQKWPKTIVISSRIRTRRYREWHRNSTHTHYKKMEVIFLRSQTKRRQLLYYDGTTNRVQKLRPTNSIKLSHLGSSVLAVDVNNQHHDMNVMKHFHLAECSVSITCVHDCLLNLFVTSVCCWPIVILFKSCQQVTI